MTFTNNLSPLIQISAGPRSLVRLYRHCRSHGHGDCLFIHPSGDLSSGFHPQGSFLYLSIRPSHGHHILLIYPRTFAPHALLYIKIIYIYTNAAVFKRLVTLIAVAAGRFFFLSFAYDTYKYIYTVYTFNGSMSKTTTGELE